MAGARRTYMLMPGHERHKAVKAAGLATDAVLLDLEDAVPEAVKETARETVAESCRSIDFGPRELMIRINGLDTAHYAADLAMLEGLPIDGIYVPKVESAASLARAVDDLSKLRPGLSIVATIETARGLTAVEEIAAVPGIEGLFFGSGDFSLSTGIEISRESLLYPRARIAVAAAAYGLQPIDVAYFRDVKDAAAAREDALAARALGYTGKVVFHPAQIDAVNGAFTPEAGEVARAERIIAAYHASAREGRGVFLLDGEFVAIDIMLMAERTLARAKAAGLRAA